MRAAQISAFLAQGAKVGADKTTKPFVGHAGRDLFLASDACRMMTGQALVIDSGAASTG